MQKTEYLLNQVDGLLKSYEKLAKSTGENFNIFTVMGVENDEVKTHSRIIAELLNPKGSHSQGSIFLKLFFEEIEELNNIKNFDFDNAKVKVEEHIGEINKEYTIGGYIDIVIKDNKGNILVIENKIDAPDQKGQLLRYKNHYKNCKLIYLTKDGKTPSKESYCHPDEKININIEDIILVCYKNMILSWIERCHKEAIQQPMLREMLKQYSNLLKKLTHQTINNELKMDIQKLIKNNFLEASEIADNFKLVKDEIINAFFNEVLEDVISPNEGWLFSIEKLHGKKELYYLIYKKEWKDVYIYIRRDPDAVFYGITISDRTLIDKSVILLKDKDENLKNLKSSGHSVIWSGDFCVKINSHKDVLSLIEEREEKLKTTKEFITKLMEKYENLCNEIAKHISINISVDIVN
jgi:hypothetical protein